MLLTRVSYPFLVGNQIIEPGIKLTRKMGFQEELSAGVTTNDKQYTLDQRVAASFILYPKPFGVQAEYNIGKGPRYNKLTNTVDESSLEGYVTLNYKWDLPKDQKIYPLLNFNIMTEERNLKKMPELCG
jgi:hypothetical protein